MEGCRISKLVQLLSNNNCFSFFLFFLDNYLFKEILELVDLDLKAAGDADGCAQFHFMPRFVRELPGN